MDGFEPDEDVLPTRSWDDRSLAFHLLGDVDYAHMDALQSKLGRELRRDIRPRIIVLLCEHPSSITVGRRGSRRHLLRMLDHDDRSALTPRWVERTGGCILHGPGQLAVCVIAPLEQFGWSHGEFRMRVHEGVLAYLREDVRLSVSYADPDMGIWGRSGAVLAYGWGNRDEVTQHGFYLNVHADPYRWDRVDFLPPDEPPAGCTPRMTSLLAEQRRPVRMAQVRAGLLPALAQSLDCERYHMFTGHPYLSRIASHVSRTSDLSR